MSTVISIEGKHASGVITTPHRYSRGEGSGKFVVSRSKYKVDYIYCETLDEVSAYADTGYRVRMSNPTKGITAPSGIVRASLEIKRRPGLSIPTLETLLPEVIKHADDLDAEGVVKRRKEQTMLRASLIGESSHATCTICHHSFPTGLLVAAHIKKRSECSNAEKLDFKNIATLMCNMGCDSLFENGYIFIESGHVIDGDRKDATSAVIEFIRNIVGNSVHNWSGSEKYYKWHKELFK